MFLVRYVLFFPFYFPIIAVTSISIFAPLRVILFTSTIVDTGSEFLKYSFLIGDTISKSFISVRYITAFTTLSRLAPTAFNLLFISSNTSFVCSDISVAMTL